MLFPAACFPCACGCVCVRQVCQDLRTILKIEGCELFKSSINRPNLFYEVWRPPSPQHAPGEAGRHSCRLQTLAAPGVTAAARGCRCPPHWPAGEAEAGQGEGAGGGDGGVDPGQLPGGG